MDNRERARVARRELATRIAIAFRKREPHYDAWAEQLSILWEVTDGWRESGEARAAIAAPCDESPNPICPRCMGTGKYQRFPTEPQKDCAICNGTGRITEEAPLPTAREHDAFTMRCPKCGIDVFAHGETCAQPIPGLQRTAGDVIRQFRESGSEDWGELESAINWWLWNDALPTLGKSVSEGRLREATYKSLFEGCTHIDQTTRSDGKCEICWGVACRVVHDLRALESA